MGLENLVELASDRLIAHLRRQHRCVEIGHLGPLQADLSQLESASLMWVLRPFLAMIVSFCGLSAHITDDLNIASEGRSKDTPRDGPAQWQTQRVN